jgi:hypothetical protein
MITVAAGAILYEIVASRLLSMIADNSCKAITSWTGFQGTISRPIVTAGAEVRAA